MGRRATGEGKHWRRARSGPVIERFWRKCEYDPSTGCVLWMGSRHARGYGHFWNGERVVRAHRWLWEYLVGPIPEGLELDHVKARGCTSRSCVNLAHLEPVTHRENVLRGDGPCARDARKTHCVNGHEFTSDNLVPGRVGRRECLTCYRIHRGMEVAA